MLRVIEIIDASPYYLLCKFNNGVIKKLEILPIIEKHKHLNGVESLLSKNVFNKVRIGEFGEIVWDKIVRTIQDEQELIWDYDISPEFAYQNSITVETPFTKAS